MTNYEVGLIFGLFALSYFLVYLSEFFQVQGSKWSQLIINFALNILLKMFAIATVIFNLLFIRLILQDQVQSAVMVNILKLYDSYLRIFMLGFVLIFFVLYFINAFLQLVENWKINDYNKKADKSTGNKFERYKNDG